MSFKERFHKFIQDSKRVLIVSKKPSREEFMAALKITGLGILIIGIVGLITFLVFHYLDQFLA